MLGQRAGSAVLIAADLPRLVADARQDVTHRDPSAQRGVVDGVALPPRGDPRPRVIRPTATSAPRSSGSGARPGSWPAG
jgi:hypothetical protein